MGVIGRGVEGLRKVKMRMTRLKDWREMEELFIKDPGRARTGINFIVKG